MQSAGERILQLSGSNSSLHFAGTVTVETVVWVVTVVVLVVHVPHTPGQSDATGNGAFGTLSSQNCKIAGRRQSGPSATPLHPGVVVVVVPVVVVSVTLVEVSVTVVSVAVVAVTVVPVVAVTVVAVPVIVVPVVTVPVVVVPVIVEVVEDVVMQVPHITGQASATVSPSTGSPMQLTPNPLNRTHESGSSWPLQRPIVDVDVLELVVSVNEVSVTLVQVSVTEEAVVSVTEVSVTDVTLVAVAVVVVSVSVDVVH